MMAWGKLRLGAWDQFEEFYKAQVQGTIGSIDGLRQRLLLRSTEDPDEGLSLSVWDNEEALVRYERSGLRREHGSGGGESLPGRVLGQAFSDNRHHRLESVVKLDSQKSDSFISVIPAKAGIQGFQQEKTGLDGNASGFRLSPE